MNWTTITAAVKKIVQESEYINQNAVFDYEKTDLGGFPAVTISASDSPARFADTGRNMRNYTFSIKIFQERLQQSETNAERILRSCVDDLIQRFDADPLLDGLLLSGGYLQAAPSKWGYSKSDQVTLRYAEILLVVITVQ